MNAEFNWWLLIVGLVVGAGLVWFVVTDARRREHDIELEERPREALWVSSVLEREGQPVDRDVVERVLELHRVYLDAPPPDDPDISLAATSGWIEAQVSPTSTGSGPLTAPAASTRDTPNVSSPVDPTTAGEGPIQ